MLTALNHLENNNNNNNNNHLDLKIITKNKKIYMKIHRGGTGERKKKEREKRFTLRRAKEKKERIITEKEKEQAGMLSFTKLFLLLYFASYISKLDYIPIA